MDLAQWISTGDDSVPPYLILRTFGKCLETFFIVTTMCEGIAPVMQLVEARTALKYPARHRTTQTIKNYPIQKGNYPVQNASTADVEKPCNM